MTANPRPLTPDEIAIAREMYEAGRGSAFIASHLSQRAGQRVGRTTVHTTLKNVGVQMRSQGVPPGSKRGPYNKQHREGPRDPVTNYPIGQVPPGHPLYDADQEMLRARLRKLEPVNPWRQSSLVG